MPVTRGRYVRFGQDQPVDQASICNCRCTVTDYIFKLGTMTASWYSSDTQLVDMSLENDLSDTATIEWINWQGQRTGPDRSARDKRGGSTRGTYNLCHFSERHRRRDRLHKKRQRDPVTGAQTAQRGKQHHVAAGALGDPRR